MSEDMELERKEFPFPFKPYDVQESFMTSLYSTLQQGKVGIFESPTGTGKSLSLLCASVTWLRDYEQRRKQQLENELSVLTSDISKAEDEEDWFTAQTKSKNEQEKLHKIKSEYDTIVSQEKRIQQIRQENSKKKKRDSSNVDLKSKKNCQLNDDPTDDTNSKDSESAHDDDLILKDYNSASEASSSEDEYQDCKEEPHVTKIFYCSRTHSQLSQFVHEIQQSPFKHDLRIVTLGSRQNLCINDAVQKLKSLTLMNERCLQMHKSKNSPKLQKSEGKRIKQSGSCPYQRHLAMLNLRDILLAEPKDIEETHDVGQEMKACPYYGSRYGIPEAEVVVLPYNILLQKSAREACGIKLTGNVVIIDEAHNLLETINNIHSVNIQKVHFSAAHAQLSQYLNRFHSRLNPRNIMYVKQILFILSAVDKYLDLQAKSECDSEVMTCSYFLNATKIDNINLFKILKYLEASQICQKLHGFSTTSSQVVLKPRVNNSVASVTSFLQSFQKGSVAKMETNSATPESEDQDGVSSPLLIIRELFKALTNPSKDGRIIVTRLKPSSKSCIKFVLLNPAAHFQDIVSEARSVILAGGTMQPVSEFIEQLFIPAGATQDRIVQFACGHVIPKDNFLAICLSHGPLNKQLEFTYQNRDSTDVMDETGRVLANLCAVVPGGMVCFFPSYDYEDKIYKHWKATGLLDRISAKKQVFREPRKSSDVAKTLQEFAKSAVQQVLSSKANHSQTGALLLSIVGGKMSEGINFSDQLGRCIVVVGMPYPNVKSPELKEKIDYLNANFPRTSDGRMPGQVYYENLCMKAVNQSIGRAIRHRNDYACIVLLDSRYQRQSIQNLLPGWVAVSVKVCDKFGQAFALVRKFFSDKKGKPLNC